jgi:hypothetical protein
LALARHTPLDTGRDSRFRVKKLKKKNHGEFWLWYLDAAVPAAWASVAG